MQSKIPITTHITYDGFNYIIDLFRADTSAWIHVERPSFKLAMQDLEASIAEEPTLFIAMGGDYDEE